MAVKLVMLHSPLVGPGTWRTLAPLLRARGFDVAVPDLSVAMQGESPFYSRLVQAARAAIDDPSHTILVAHSGAGSLIPAVADNGAAAGAVFVDALLPHPGQSWFETASDSLNSLIKTLAHQGRVPRWHLWWPKGAIEKLLGDQKTFENFASELNDLPLSFFSEIGPAVPLPPRLACAYLQLGPMNEAEALAAGRSGWPVKRVGLHHLAMLTNPAEVADAIESLLQAIADRRT